MSTKRMKLEFATITVAGYHNSTKVTNAITYKIMGINEADFDVLVERERKEVETLVQAELDKGNKSKAKAKVTKKEKKYIDGIVTSKKPIQ